MLNLAGMWRPIVWWAESGHITKSIGPFLKDQQREQHVWFSVSPIIPSADKVQRAQAMIGLMSLGRVKFPAFQPWCAAAVDEMLKFNNGTHDDFVDTLSLIGLGLHRIVKGTGAKVAGAESGTPKVGTLGWVKWASDKEKMRNLALRRRAA
jgi:predicted phage terminase large subunit-like protein